METQANMLLDTIRLNGLPSDATQECIMIIIPSFLWHMFYFENGERGVIISDNH